MTDAAVVEQSVQPEGNSAVPVPSQVSDKYKVTVDGEEHELTLDELKRDYQLRKASQKRFDEASKIKKESETYLTQVKGLLENSKNGELSWLKQVVPQDVLRQWAERELLEHIEWNKLSPAEQKAITLEQKLKERDEADRRREEELEEHHRSQLQAEADKYIEQDIYQAVKELGYDVKVTPRLIRRIAENMYASLEVSDDPEAVPIPAKLAREKAFSSAMDEAKELLSVLEPEKAIALLPPSLRAAIRRQDVSEVRGQLEFKPNKKTSDEPAPIRTKRKTGTIEDYFKRLDKKIR